MLLQHCQAQSLLSSGVACLQEDRPDGGRDPHRRHYWLPAPGGYKLHRGTLLPFPGARGPPAMLARP